MEERIVIRQEDTFTPEMRERLEAFYDQVEIDLYEDEVRRHWELCERLARAADARGERAKAAKIADRFRKWAEAHRKAFLAELDERAAGEGRRA